MKQSLFYLTNIYNKLNKDCGYINVENCNEIMESMIPFFKRYKEVTEEVNKDVNIFLNDLEPCIKCKYNFDDHNKQ